MTTLNQKIKAELMRMDQDRCLINSCDLWKCTPFTLGGVLYTPGWRFQKSTAVVGGYQYFLLPSGNMRKIHYK